MQNVQTQIFCIFTVSVTCNSYVCQHHKCVEKSPDLLVFHVKHILSNTGRILCNAVIPCEKILLSVLLRVQKILFYSHIYILGTACFTETEGLAATLLQYFHEHYSHFLNFQSDRFGVFESPLEFEIKS